MIEVARGDSPLVLGLPHTGTQIPGEILSRLNATGQAMADTDWHIDRLYDGLVADITTVRTPIHRYVIDVNRDPADISLYPGQNTTSLCALTDFDGAPIYRAGMEPDAEEIARRSEAFHAPYHDALTTELERLRAVHGFTILYDCHSIRSHIPFLFDGTLPDFNIGTNERTTCAPELEQYVQQICANADGYSHVVNGRFKGGWTTRHNGRPKEGLHAIQMELAQSTYMAEAAPWTWAQDKVDRLRRPLAEILTTLKNWSPA
ncbi:N-formylglutamate deformylase [Ruegeria sp. 2205SS24-7]|uniref:N-formylglutamate deformylase n=1 Tax=Ruegeria discodermiae TaxID=3064389 RepID=UPI0027419AA7|nr:N-formylglutamate deformylase [Ruegeria sp. 2205SS24-7]MDP5219971.1 N-formylglutamate deformylase [Ruegeria sp. 2205SS24-7]